MGVHLEEIKNKQIKYYPEYHEKVQELKKSFETWGNYPLLPRDDCRGS